MNNTGKISWWKLDRQEKTWYLSWGQDHTTHEAPTNNCNGYEAATEEEAKAKCLALVKERVERGGFSYEIPYSVPFRPMLAQTHNPDSPPDWEGYAVQPKLDGVRCIATNKGLVTRRNEPITSVPHITEACRYLPDDMALDGELYIHRVDLQTIQSYVLRKRPYKLSYMIEYHVYDSLNIEANFGVRHCEAAHSVADLNRHFENDKQNLAEELKLLKQYRVEDFPIKLVTTTFHSGAPDVEILTDYFKSYTKDHYEGAMIRNLDTPYELNYRSPQLLKYKERQDAEFEIIDIVEAYDSTGTYVCRTEDGNIFEATPKMTKDRKRYLLREKRRYIGKMLTVEYETLSKDGTPLKPIGKAIRKD